jgi:hypothetical protein
MKKPGEKPGFLVCLRIWTGFDDQVDRNLGSVIGRKMQLNLT